MNPKKILIAGGIILALMAIIALAFVAMQVTGNPVEASIKNEIEKAGYCTSKEDCVKVLLKCPLTCSTFVNRKEAERINAMIKGYPGFCEHGCLEAQEAECVYGKCRAKYPEKPPQ